MCGPALPIIGAGAALGSLGLSAYSGIKSAKAQKKASAQAEREAAETQAANERAINRANQKSPNLAGIIAANRLSNSGGVGSTMLSRGAGKLGGTLLGRTTLLGG